MINMMIVAGESSENLANFLTQRGTFTVDFVFNDIHSNLDEIMNQIIKVDKMLYLYQSDDETGSANTNVRMDMQALQRLLTHNSFFGVGEIIFLCNAGDLSTQAKRYFSSVMSECKKSNYMIKTIEGSISFAGIYDSLIGITQSKDFNNAYRKMYRVERGKESNIAYERKNDSDLIIEPFSYDSIKAWEEQKKLASTIEHSKVFSDESSFHLQRINNPDFSEVDLSDYSVDRSIVLVLGKKGTGKSVWASVLATSAIANGKRACIFDLTDSQDVASMLESSSKFTAAERKDIFGKLESGSVVSCSDADVFSYLAKDSITVTASQFDSVFVVAEFCEFDRLTELLGRFIAVTIVTTGVSKVDVEAVSAVIARANGNKVVILNGKESVFRECVTPEKAKELCSSAKLVKSVEFENLDAGPAFYKAIVGVKK